MAASDNLNFQQMQLFPTPGGNAPSTSAPASTPEVQSKPAHDPMQLQMFMYPHEILRDWEPLFGDYRKKEDPRRGQFTDRPVRTEGFPNAPVEDVAIHEAQRGRMTAAINLLDNHGGRYVRVLPHVRAETREQLLARKVAEAETSTVHGQHTRYGQRIPAIGGEKTMAQSIAEEGVKDPVWLATPDTKEIGIYEGKPEIYGGHHRIATAAKYAPDRLIAINWAPDFETARWDPRYR